ncbi:hypothetical protein PC116_g27822 [Phytophthora cactorum]|uniref:Uncharacterized protein n=1 Tax=Phytophthora cactorum TaxID=29920 RepID=A0A8T1JKY5_9STRA|nr:hypothetical protein PC114_g15571 [Phytophthora cactorum]KAG2919650.1 hypothetical protein PC117_g16706 [Phytophthora cactorum]KAG2963611.1 hypothetical protein PC119_g25460 [Phytophthora cactorum]KAG4223715.1 hypothetical protein PC116_g27822 [Phytophthora cactorum]
MSLDFVFGLPADDHGNTGILVFVCQLSNMVHLAPVPDTVTGEQAARLFVDGIFAIMVFRRPSSRTVTRGLPLRSSKRCSNCLERGCTCLLLTIPRRMARQSVSTGCSKTLCAVFVRQLLARGQSDSPWLSLHSTTRSTRRPGSPHST